MKNTTTTQTIGGNRKEAKTGLKLKVGSKNNQTVVMLPCQFMIF